MSYLLDKKAKRKRISYIALAVFLCLILFYFRLGIFRVLSGITQTVFHPALVAGGYVKDKLGSIGSYFSSKNSLYLENQRLSSELNDDKALMSNYDSLAADDASLKETLGRKDPKIPMTLAAILSKPNQSPYDTLLIDAGITNNVKVGNIVFALGNVPIGRVSDVYANSSKVILFSSSGEKTEAVISGKNIVMQLVGRGGGNFEMILPRDATLTKGDQAVLPGITPYVVGVVETILSDPRDPFQKALLVSPVNIEELKFVEIDEQR